jgi:hypothetical protein
MWTQWLHASGPHASSAAAWHGLIYKSFGRATNLRTSLYADDAIVFVAPIKNDIQNLAPILECLGEVTYPCTDVYGFLYTTTSIKTPVWHVPWLDGRNSKDSAPKIFLYPKERSGRLTKLCMKLLGMGKWAGIKTSIWSILHNFVKLHYIWVLLYNVQLYDSVEDDITWKLTLNGRYFAVQP